ncbi:sensor histidine kinase [Streptosporangium sp. NPDC051022]|uniref:sensor histidine kinase n=1 Tax=Streptosporangium sp. NPDC051022 TaxID=3155752 RepID=UPI0034207596
MNATTKLGEAERRLKDLDLGRVAESPLTDLAVSLLLAVLAIVQLDTRSFPAMAAAMLATLPQALRRGHPGLSVLLTALGALGLFYTGALIYDPPVAVLLSGALTLHTVLTGLSRVGVLLFGGSVTVVFLLFVVWRSEIGSLLSFASDERRMVFWALAMFVTAVAVASFAYAQRSRAKINEVRADNLENLRKQAAMAERARIAREMHDIVAHSVSMIAVQAETASYTLDGLDDRAKREFAEIATSARTTLTEMRRLLGVLRADITAAPETAPQPGLARLPELIERHEGEVDLDVVGEAVPLPQAVDISAYRIVQEALTNARVHAPGARVSIEIAYRPALLALRITDDGPGPAGDTSNGHGLVGMRERALALGGWFTAGPGPAGGFLIQAGLPLE